MRRDIARRLAQRFTVVCADLRGSGPSTCPNHASRGLTLTLDTTSHAATITSDLGHNPPLFVRIIGSDQTLPNGDALVSWGSLREITEFNAAGQANRRRFMTGEASAALGVR